MALAKEIYEAFEAVVGKRNISQDPRHLETYRCAAGPVLGPLRTLRPTHPAAPGGRSFPAPPPKCRTSLDSATSTRSSSRRLTTFWSVMGYIGLGQRRSARHAADAKHRDRREKHDCHRRTLRDRRGGPGRGDEERTHHEHAGGGLQQRGPGQHRGLGGVRAHIDLHGLREREHARRRMDPAQRRPSPHRLARSRLRLVLRRRARTEHQRDSPGYSRDQRDPWGFAPGSPSASPLAGPHVSPAPRDHPCLSSAVLPDNFKGVHPLLPLLGCLCEGLFRTP